MVLSKGRILTYMSIQELVKERVASGRIAVLEPIVLSDPMRRTMVMTPEIAKLIAGPWPNANAERRCGRLRGDLEMFVTGQELSVCLRPYEAGPAYMGLLEPPAAGVWDIRSRDPSPGLRVLGLFASRDLFVAMNCAPRSVQADFLPDDPLGARDSAEWRSAIKIAKACWRQLFQPYTPIVGSNVREYLSDKFNIV